MAAVQRVAARVLPVSPTGEVLLLLGQDPARPGDLHWVSIGGAVEAGESLAEAAVRELREETGIAARPEDLIGPLHRATHPFSWDGVEYVSDNHFFGLPVERSVQVSFGGLEAAEVGNVLDAGWWSPEALLADGRAAAPDMPEIMAAAIDAVLRGALRGAQ